MKINNLNSNVNFKGVYVVAGKDRQIEKLKDKLESQNEPFIQFHLSDYDYKKHKNYDLFNKAKNEGNSIDAFVTGTDDCASVMLREVGWLSVKEIVKRTNNFFDLNKDGIQGIINKIQDND